MGRISRKLVALWCRKATADEGASMERDLQQFARSLSDSAHLVRHWSERGYDPLHVRYILGHEFAMSFSDAMAAYDEFDEYFARIGDPEVNFAGELDEQCPVTGNFYSLWRLFDLRFGADQETMGSCIVDVLDALQPDREVRRLMQSLADSRMGVYQHQGSDGQHVRLRELATGTMLRGHSTSGYAGHPGELWYVRLGPPLDEQGDYHVTLTTPYVLTEASVDDWTAYLNKSLLQGDAGGPRSLRELLKFGRTPTTWLEYAVRAFVRADDQAVYLAGLPDVPSSLPNAQCLEAMQELATRPAAEVLQDRVTLMLTPPQSKALVTLLPELGDLPPANARRPTPTRLLRLHLLRAESRAEQKISQLKGAQRKPYERILECAATDRMLVTGQAVFELRIVLHDDDPEIWRTIQTPDCTLEHLHVLIQAAMGWENAHAYGFELDGTLYTTDDYGEDDAIHEGDVELTYLSQVVPVTQRAFTFDYRYDFGDEWRHGITVQRIVPAAASGEYPVCLDGRGACPPEDCGGMYRYRYLLDALADPESDEHDTAVEWLGGGSRHTKAFNSKTATRRMRRAVR